jgi:hypothetical protein
LFKPAARSKLREEIDSWLSFVESLKPEDKQLFNDMVHEAQNYLDFVEYCEGDNNTTEAFLLGLLVSNQKTINSLSKRIEIIKGK